MNCSNKVLRVMCLSAALSISLSACKSETSSSAGADTQVAGGSTDGAPSAAAADSSTVEESGISFAVGAKGFDTSPRGSLTCNLDAVGGSPAGGNAIVPKSAPTAFGGWAFDDEGRQLVTSLIFSGSSGIFAAKAKSGGLREDVAQAFANAAANKSGFNSVVNFANVPPGEYAVSFVHGEGMDAMVCDLKTTITIQL